jgi:hypothetical protein
VAGAGFLPTVLPGFVTLTSRIFAIFCSVSLAYVRIIQPFELNVKLFWMDDRSFSLLSRALTLEQHETHDRHFDYQ